LRRIRQRGLEQVELKEIGRWDKHAAFALNAVGEVLSLSLIAYEIKDLSLLQGLTALTWLGLSKKPYQVFLRLGRLGVVKQSNAAFVGLTLTGSAQTAIKMLSPTYTGTRKSSVWRKYI